MNGAEKFHLIAGILGFVVNIVTVCLWVAHPKLSVGQPNSNTFAYFAPLTFFVWLSSVWFLTRIGLKKAKARRKTVEPRQMRIGGATVGTGILFWILYFPLYTDEAGKWSSAAMGSAAWLLFFAAIPIIISVSFLMDLFHPEDTDDPKPPGKGRNRATTND